MPKGRTEVKTTKPERPDNFKLIATVNSEEGPLLARLEQNLGRYCFILHYKWERLDHISVSFSYDSLAQAAERMKECFDVITLNNYAAEIKYFGKLLIESEVGNVMEVTKEGKKLSYEFACDICECEFFTEDRKEVEIKETINVWGTRVKSIYADCPNCGAITIGRIKEMTELKPCPWWRSENIQ